MRSKSINTLIDSTPIIIPMINGGYILPLSIWVKPRDGDVITVDSSLDGGLSWELPWVVTASDWDDVLLTGVTHIRFTRSSGTGILSTAGCV